jgi:phage terminase small subunit
LIAFPHWLGRPAIKRWNRLAPQLSLSHFGHAP